MQLYNSAIIYILSILIYYLYDARNIYINAVFVCFLDASKAFGRVNQRTLFKKFGERGVPAYTMNTN